MFYRQYPEDEALVYARPALTCWLQLRFVPLYIWLGQFKIGLDIVTCLILLRCNAHITFALMQK